MIKDKCFNKEWIEGFRKEKKLSKINPPILEKMIYAMYLLQNLIKADFEFIFKGGTSLILLMKDANRFSVDIDIITRMPKAEIEVKLENIIKNSQFIKWTLDEELSYKKGIPKAHYELVFLSNFNQHSNTILLDVLFENNLYPVLQKKPIKSKWIEISEEINVQIPSLESIFGDKLTAFAPTTTGILYNKGKEIEIIKQLFDLGHLFEEVLDLKIVAQSFEKFAKKEINYRNLEISITDIMDDIINTAKILAFKNKNNQEPEKTNYLELQDGIKKFGQFIISGNFRIDNAISSAARVAYIAAKIRTNNLSPIERFSKQDISNWIIEDPDWNHLNKLKKFADKSAFYYWYMTIKCLANSKK